MLEKNSDREVHVEKIEQRPMGSIAFGLERIGLIAVQKPVLSCIILVGLIIGALFGIDRIKIDDSLSQLFRSNSKDYKQYEAETKRFPAVEFDVLVVVEGKTLLKRENLEKLRDLVTDIQLVEGTRGIISLFSARQAPAPGKLPAALFPSELPEGADYDKFIETVKTNEIIRGKLLSEDGTLALIVLSLEPEVVASNKLAKTVGDIRKLMAEDLQGSGLNAELSGVPVMQLEIRNAVKRDGLTYNILGILAGCIIAIIFFRKISFMVVAAFPPIIAIVLALGGLGWANFNLNMFLNVMTPLIMVISFSDSMQLTFAARDRLIAGQDKYTAFKNAVMVVGPACVLTHGTAGISFIALQFSNSDLIRKFGEAGLAATIIALIAVSFRREIPERRCRRSDVAQFLLLDRGAHGLEARPVQPDRGDLCRRSGGNLRQSGAALPARRSGAGQAAGGGGVRASRRQADRSQCDRRADRISQGRLAVCAGYAADHRRCSRNGGETGGRRQCLVVGDAAAVACGKSRKFRRRDLEGICQPDP